MTTRAFGLLALITLVMGCKTVAKNPHLNEGNQYARDGLLREAADSYRAALTAQPNLTTAHRNLGMVLVKSADYTTASQHLEKSLARYENDFDTNFYLGEAYRGLDKYADAIFRYQKALKIKADEPRALKALSWSYFKIRYYSEALTVGKKLMDVAPRDEQGTIIVARTLLKLKRMDEALQLVRSTKTKIPPSSVPYFLSVEGDVLADMGRDEEALGIYQAALKDQSMLAGALLGQGRLLLKMGRTDQAIALIERATRIRPQLTEAHYLLGVAYEPTDRQKSQQYYQTFRRQALADPEFIIQLNEVNKKIGTASSANPKSTKTRRR